MRPNSSTMTRAEQAVEQMNIFAPFDYKTFLKNLGLNFITDHLCGINEPNRSPLLHLIVLTFDDDTRCVRQLKYHGMEVWSVLY